MCMVKTQLDFYLHSSESFIKIIKILIYRTLFSQPFKNSINTLKNCKDIIYEN